MLDNETTKKLSNGKRSMYTFVWEHEDTLSTRIWQCIAKDIRKAKENLHQNIDVDEKKVKVFIN